MSPEAMPSLWNIIHSLCCAIVMDLHVSQKFSDVNDAELPHLEGMVMLDQVHVMLSSSEVLGVACKA